MSSSKRNSLVSKITEEFKRLEKLFTDIRSSIASLESLRRRAEKAENPIEKDPALLNYVNLTTVNRVVASFSLSIANSVEKLSDEVSQLFTETASLLKLLDSLTEELQEACHNQIQNFLVFNELIIAVNEVREILIQEMDLTCYSACLHISPTLVPPVAPAFHLASSYLSERSITFSLWREEVAPMFSVCKM
ncbi:unnamed protein product [Dibothriocephalus latus]|uniref:Uncharacterized protein n=1 Tax=Dibothriocephalus latus TaxID=60516 RepID=A0A3P7L8L0_DIBLA|nr:unnamed protein product [Dibothriocephalus latus]